MLFVYNHTAYQSATYKVFTDYYSKLVDTLSVRDLSHYFVSDKIISPEDHIQIIRSAIYMPQDATKLLLDIVSLQLQNGNSTVLNKMLLIVDHHGVTTAKAVSREMRSKLSTIECEDYSNEQGTQLSVDYMKFN